MLHTLGKKNDQANQNQKQNQKQMNPTRNDVPFSAPRQKNTIEERNQVWICWMKVSNQ